MLFFWTSIRPGQINIHNRLIIFCSLLLLLNGAGCRKGECLGKAGRIVQVKRQAAAIRQIDLYDNVNVILKQDTATAITVEAGENMIPNILTTVTKGVLTIKNETSCEWLRNPSETVNVYVPVNNLDSINYNGSGNITSANTLQPDDLKIFSQKGAGNIELTLQAKKMWINIERENTDVILHGSADYIRSYTNPRASIDYSGIKVEDLFVEYAGVRNTTVNVSRSLNAIIFYTGDVYYKGNPAYVQTQYYSSGRLLPAP